MKSFFFLLLVRMLHSGVFFFGDDAIVFLVLVILRRVLGRQRLAARFRNVRVLLLDSLLVCWRLPGARNNDSWRGLRNRDRGLGVPVHVRNDDFPDFPGVRTIVSRRPLGDRREDTLEVGSLGRPLRLKLCFPRQGRVKLLALLRDLGDQHQFPLGESLAQELVLVQLGHQVEVLPQEPPAVLHEPFIRLGLELVSPAAHLGGHLGRVPQQAVMQCREEHARVAFPQPVLRQGRCVGVPQLPQHAPKPLHVAVQVPRRHILIFFLLNQTDRERERETRMTIDQPINRSIWKDKGSKRARISFLFSSVRFPPL
mmetsp:Transcript_3899/g.11280  ORF Transcript_3899/g.11280 Transcript_3899/m.11280 type:complete len:312 (-) Transcript_3899:598-1533(-)